MAANKLKLRARDELIRLHQKNTGSDFHELNPKQQSIAATSFFIEEILNPTRTAISEEDIADGIVDGADDLGCDFVHRDDSHVILIQTKYRKSSASENPADVTHFQSILKRLRNPELKVNNRLKPILSDIDWTHDTFELIFLTFSKMDGRSQARRISEQAPAYPEDIPDIDKRCDWKFYDEEDLNMQIRSARELARGIPNHTTTLYPLGKRGTRGALSVLGAEASGYQSYIMILDARQIVRAYDDSGRDALFSLNIRNYIGNTKTNKEMINTLESNPAQFFLYNNGISCLATSVNLSEEKIQVTGLQVINGAQTVKAIVQASKDISRMNKKAWDQILPNVLVRITEIPEGYGSTGKVGEAITQFNNTQNTIKVSDFRSNDAVQKYLVEQFGTINRRGKKIAYLPKRTDRTPPNSEVIRLEEFSKAIYSFLHEFSAFSGSSTFLFNEESSGGYAKVFGDGQAIWERMPEDEFRIRAAIYWISQEIGNSLKATKSLESDPEARLALERKWVLVYAFGVVMRCIYPNGSWRAQLIKLHKGEWSLGADKKGAIVLAIYNAARSGVIMAYKLNKQHNPNYNHRNWMRGKNTPNEIKGVIETIVAPIQNIGDIPS